MTHEGTGSGQSGGHGLRSPRVGRLLRSQGPELGGQLKVAGLSQQDPSLEESELTKKPTEVGRPPESALCSRGS